MKKIVLRTLSYLLVAALAACFTLWAFLPRSSYVPVGSTKLEQLENLLLEKFVGGTDQTVLEDAAANAMIAALGDRWSYYISAEDYAAYKEQMNNAYVGIGVTITALQEGGFEITQVNDGGSAQEAGLQVGDVMIGVDGTSVLEMTASECRQLVRGEENTTVEVTVRRGDEELTVKVTRKTVETAVATGTMLENKVGYIKIANFDSRCYQETVAAIEALLQDGAESLIFDVRYNPGGYKHELVELLDYLLPEGVLFRSEDYQGNQSVDRSDANCLDIPMAVLVNGSSYSAAEFFAAALSEYEAAVIVGEQTSGKGYFQQTFLLSDGSAVAVSTGKYCTPNGVSLEGVGITPDKVVAVDAETAAGIYAGTLEPTDDPQVQAAMAELLKTK